MVIFAVFIGVVLLLDTIRPPPGPAAVAHHDPTPMTTAKSTVVSNAEGLFEWVAVASQFVLDRFGKRLSNIFWSPEQIIVNKACWTSYTKKSWKSTKFKKHEISSKFLVDYST